tara:strand:+ start:125 stop:814 length:690 start_codon:yes stop_codon:yes gene_type:complete
VVDEASALASRLAHRLKKRGWTISTAESCTGGLLSSLLTDISGASSWFLEGWVVYTNESKSRELGVAESSFGEGADGAVSNKVAVQMARGARYKSGSNVSVAITGIAGPAIADSDKEVGRVHVAVIAEDFFLARRMDFGLNDRLDNKRSFAAFALRLTLETFDRLVSDEKKEKSRNKTSKGSDSDETSPSDDDQSSEEWEGVISWDSDEDAISRSLGKVDLASLTDWDE